jgi:hypothetical protein
VRTPETEAREKGVGARMSTWGRIVERSAVEARGGGEVVVCGGPWIGACVVAPANRRSTPAGVGKRRPKPEEATRR